MLFGALSIEKIVEEVIDVESMELITPNSILMGESLAAMGGSL